MIKAVEGATVLLKLPILSLQQCHWRTVLLTPEFLPVFKKWILPTLFRW